VIRGHDSATLSVPGVGLGFATLVGWDRTRDVALLRFSSGGFTPRIARLPAGEVLSGGVTIYRDETPGLFDPVMALGFVPTISKTTPIATFGGIGVAWNIVPGDVGQYQFDAAITNGMSGGALFDANGTLAGMILSAGSFEGNNRALSWREILEALPELRAGVENP
jgi:S1-C subfamily serine protease